MMLINPTKQTVYGGFSTGNVNYNNSGCLLYTSDAADE